MKSHVFKLFSPKGMITLALFILIVGGVYYGVTTNGFGLLNQANVGGNGGQQGTVASCQQNPTLLPTINNQLKPGTTVTASYLAKINGGAPTWITSSTTLPCGGNVQVLVNSSMSGSVNYLAKIAEIDNLGSGPNAFNVALLQTEVPTEKIITSNNQVASKLLTAPGTNESSTTTAITDTLRVIPGLYQATGDMIVVIDANDSGKVLSITSAYPLYERGIPNNYQSQGSASRVAVFRVPSTQSQLDIPFTLNPASGATIVAKVNVTIYQAQDYVDINGQFLKSGIEDSLGTAKYANQSSTSYYIT